MDLMKFEAQHHREETEREKRERERARARVERKKSMLFIEQSMEHVSVSVCSDGRYHAVYSARHLGLDNRPW